MHSPDVNVSRLVVVRTNFNLAQYNGTVRCKATPHEYQIFLEVDLSDQLVVGEACGARPHFGLMLVPFSPRFGYFYLDLAEDGLERWDRISVLSGMGFRRFVGVMRSIE